ncbi:hypothetical protein [Thermaerobacter subterraneus]|uniref:Uncharacterized protein n=1 Tax=Thermaerobacter subterraneus DSM 13965 TaxID=867903 RepID=K6QBS5_9FIRM|nr:hypothetical protein [Thermaerobacter subterraneus]EKP93851.1 hypothetical protein ThesuDRAFT_00095 [Thermaerobacter subterraneus DSM 13965]
MAAEPPSRGGTRAAGGRPGPAGRVGRGPAIRPAVRRSDIEDLLSRLPGVLAVRLSVNDWGAIQTVHVLATVDRGAKQIVRDIESALQARFGLRLDHKKVSVAQVRGLGPLREPVRPELAGFVTQSDAVTGKTRIEVTFRDPRDETARWDGAATGGSRRKQQAHTALLAVLDALRPLLLAAERDLELVDCELVTLAGQELLVGLYALPNARTGEATHLAGAAPLAGGVVEAAARVFLEVYEQLLEMRDRRVRQSPVYRLLELGRQMRAQMAAERAAARGTAAGEPGGEGEAPAGYAADQGTPGQAAPPFPAAGEGDDEPLNLEATAEAAVTADADDGDPELHLEQGGEEEQGEDR